MPADSFQALAIFSRQRRFRQLPTATVLADQCRFVRSRRKHPAAALVGAYGSPARLEEVTLGRGIRDYDQVGLTDAIVDDALGNDRFQRIRFRLPLQTQAKTMSLFSTSAVSCCHEGNINSLLLK